MLEPLQEDLDHTTTPEKFQLRRSLPPSKMSRTTEGVHSFSWRQLVERSTICMLSIDRLATLLLVVCVSLLTKILCLLSLKINYFYGHLAQHF